MNMTNTSRPNTSQARAALIDIVRAKSFQSGTEIKLASGRTSSLYFNMKPTMLDADGAWLIGTLVLDTLSQTPGGAAEFVGGLEMGAVPIAAAVAATSAAQGRPVRAFFVRKQAKEHGTQALIEGLSRGESLTGRRVAIVEDVTTTGGSALKAAEAVRAAGADIACVITIVDRQEGALETFANAGITFCPILTAADFV